MKRWSVASALVAAALLLSTVSGQQPEPRAYVTGELLVKFSPAPNPVQRAAMLASRSASRIRRFDTLNIEHVRVPPGLTVEAAIAAFERMPGVMLAQPNYTRYAIQSSPPNDPYWLDGTLWGLNKIQMAPVWTDITTGDGSVVIADIDTGVNFNHPDLAANMWRNPGEIPDNGVDDDSNGYIDDVYGIDTVNHDSNPIDDHGHGSHTSGTVAAVGNNGVGVVGVNWNAKLLGCKFLSAAGSGTDAGAVECFNYIVALKNRGVNIRVTSNSWGVSRGGGPPAAVLQSAIDAAGAAGIVNVFAAGNNGTNNDTAPFDPASYPLPSIVAVASSGQSDARSSFSNYGATSVHLAAPGENIGSTYLGTGYASSSGTSMAAPHVSGVAALLARLDPTLSVAAIKALLLDNVDQLPQWNGVVSSGGRLNAYRAASAVSGNRLPTASITSPAEAATFASPATLTIDVTATDSDGTIQHVAFYADGALLSTDTESPYSFTWPEVGPGNYTLTAVATDDLGGRTTSAPVHISVTSAPPSVSVTSPGEGAAFIAPASITLEATASDSDGTVQHVAFYANGAPIGTDTSSPYSITWNNVAVGSYALTAVATDDLGTTGTSAAVHVTVNLSPGRTNVAAAANGAVATASSLYGANYPASGTINGDRKGLNWGAGGGWNDGTQNAFPDWLEVEFFRPMVIDEVNVFSMQDNYTAPIEPTSSMTFTYWGVRAFDVQYWNGAGWVAVPGGSVTNNNKVWRQVLFAPVTTTKIRVSITNAMNGYSRVMEVEAWGMATSGNTAPSVSVTSPAGGTTFPPPADIAIVATAGDIDGSIQKVDFFAGGALLGTDTTSPYSFTWTNVPVGTYALTAVATDNLGATTTSAAVNVIVAVGNTPPGVAIDSPAEGATFTAPVSITVAATATDSDGSVQQVAFFANGAPIGTDATSPYSVTWTNVPVGTYTLTAVATDNSGATTTSAAVHVTVNPMPGRMNFARAVNGGVVTASSTYSGNYPASGTINGDRKGLSWGAGGGWNDGTPNAAPDWVEVSFNGLAMIDEVNVFTMQDNYLAPAEPTPAMTFTYWGIRAFEVQYWTGTAWAAVPGGAVTNNNKVWRQFLFAPVTTTKIRIFITSFLNGYSRLMEVEAWGVAATEPTSVLEADVREPRATQGRVR
jgi:subtilisin family serine protease